MIRLVAPALTRRRPLAAALAAVAVALAFAVPVGAQNASVAAILEAKKAEYAALAAQAQPASDSALADRSGAAVPDRALALMIAEERYAALATERAAGVDIQWNGRVAWPHRGTVSSPFAPRWGGFHNGVDIAAAFFTPVHAAAAGIVTVVGRPYIAVGDTAVTVMIAHGSGFSTVYVHLNDERPPVVSVGDRVREGQLIGYVGSTGWSTGPHTHFMTVLNGRPVDPMRYLP